MVSPPGTYQISCPIPSGGQVEAIFNFDPVTGIMRNVGSPPASLIVTNTSSRTTPITATVAGVAQDFNVPPGETRITKAQLSQRGIDSKDDIQQLSIAPGV